LGAATLSERCFHAVQERASVEGMPPVANPDRTKGDLAHLRMAALLHDVRHGLCSHASEQIYAATSDLREFKTNKDYAANAPGEILSYLIVKSPTFKKWFTEQVVEGCRAELDLDTICNLILGRHANKDLHFLADIISSAYDCDKLDYIARDSYYCGLALTVDLPRFYRMVSTARHKDYKVLVLRNYVPLEQILFSKMILFGSVYHHQKVKCLDAMLRSMIEHTIENPTQSAFPLRGRAGVTFSGPVDFLYANDDEFFGQANGFGDAYTQEMLRRFRQRDLFVRCVEISRRTVKKKSWDDYGRQNLVELTELPEKLGSIESEIHTCLRPEDRGKCYKRDIRLSVPGLPGFKKRNARIQTSKGAPIEYVEEYFPLEQWTEAYAHNKWRSFVYAPREIAGPVRDTAVSVLKDRLEIEIDVNKSNQSCHL